VGDAYRVQLDIKGRYRMVTWHKLPQAAATAAATIGNFYLASSWSGWGFQEMTREGDVWHIEALLLQANGQFQFVRDADWCQVICPERPDSDSSARGYGPDDGASSQGLNWTMDGIVPGDVVRIELQKCEADGEEWAVSWRQVRREDLTEDQLAESRRPRIGVAGSWSDFARQQPLFFHGLEGGREKYGTFVTIGQDGWESFQLLMEHDWNRVVHPDRYSDDPEAPIRVWESPNDGSAMDLVWTIGWGAEAATIGDIYHILVWTSNRRVLRVSWKKATSEELSKLAAAGLRPIARDV